MEEAEWKDKILAVLQQLSFAQRTAFVLRYMEDVPNGEIAEILGCAEGTVRSHIRRSILALRKRLANDYLEYTSS
jgi:RNA polymerase sigma factor (sigma-70 family)